MEIQGFTLGVLL